MAKKIDDRASRTDEDNPAWTADDFVRARPASEVLPQFIGQKATNELMRRGRGRPAKPHRKSVAKAESGLSTRSGNNVAQSRACIPPIDPPMMMRNLLTLRESSRRAWTLTLWRPTAVRAPAGRHT